MNKCVLCKNSDISSVKEYYVDNSIQYSLYECYVCGVQFWLPFQNPGSQWYENDDRYFGANNDPTLEPNWNHKKVISFLGTQTGKVLDIGCGTGNFLSHARNNGWDVMGIDFDRNAVNTAKNVFGLSNVEVSDLSDFYKKHIDSQQVSFDLVTFFDVFEHIDNHVEFLNMINLLLIKNGHIAMSMPYRNSYHWLQPNDFPPRHLTRWDEKSLIYCLESNGFKVVFIKKVPASFFYIVMKLRFKYGRYFSFGLVKKVRDKVSVKENTTLKVLNKKNLKIKIVHLLATIKDLVIFGLPAALIWCGLFFTKRRYNGLFVIAKKND